MHSLSAVLFDLDDTLIDFRKSETISLQNCYDRYFHHLISWDAFQEHYTFINRALWDLAEAGEIPISGIGHRRFQELSEKYCIPFLPEISSFYEEELIMHSDWTEGAEELLEELQTKQVPIGFVTNGFSYLQQRKNQKLQLSRFSKILVISEECGVAKPHPKIFQHALDQLVAHPDQTLMVGDSLSSDGQGARNMSMPFCWYNPKQASHSLDWEPTFIIHALKDLLKVI